MWDIVSEGIDVLLLLVDATAPHAWPDALGVGRYLAERHDTPVLVGVNRGDAVPLALETVRSAVPIDGARYTICDVTDVVSARETLIELLAMLLDQIEVDETSTV